MNGRRWLALDADMFGKPFILDLHHQFGWAGIGVWVAFLCACKRSRTPGRITFISEADARGQLGITGLDLVDNEGKEWALSDFWLFTGRKKQTRKTSRGREMNVTATHWERWQDAAKRAREAERLRMSRAQKRTDRVRSDSNTACTNVGPNSDLDLDTPLPPTGGSGRRFAPNSKNQTPNPTATPIPDWQPDPTPDEPTINRDAIKALRNNPTQP